MPMKIIKNKGNERVVNELHRTIARESLVDLATSTFSLMAFGENRQALEQLKSYRLVIFQLEPGIRTG